MHLSQNLTNLLKFAKGSKVIIASFVVLLVGGAGFVALSSNRTAEAIAERDCSDNSIIKCGVTSWSDFEKKYKANTSGDLDNILEWDNSDLAYLKKHVKEGQVHKDGRVTVDGKVVGTNARSLGRQNMPGSQKMTFGDKTFYYRSTKVSFAEESLDALVLMDDKGKAQGAIILACGNPVTLTPKTPIKKTSAKPNYQCKAIVPARIARDTYDFSVNAPVSGGAKVTKVTYTFDGKDTRTTSSAATKVRHTFDKPGRHTIKATVDFTVGDKSFSKSCALNLNVAAAATPQPDVPTPPPTPAAPAMQTGAKGEPARSEEEPAELPEAGTSALAAVAGAGSLAGAGYYWHTSRHRLIDKLLRK